MVEALKPLLETPCGPLHMRPKATLLIFVYLDFINICFRLLSVHDKMEKNFVCLSKTEKKKIAKISKS